MVFGMGAVFGIVLRRLLFWDEERLVLSLVLLTECVRAVLGMLRLPLGAHHRGDAGDRAANGPS